MADKTGTTTGRPNPHTDTGYSHATKVKHSGNNTNGNKSSSGTTTHGQWKDDTPYKNPLPPVGPLSWGINFAAQQNYKGRQKYATKEGLAKEYYIGNKHNIDPSKRTLRPNSPEGKVFLKEAGYGKTTSTNTGGDGGIKCPDGTSPPCSSVKPAGVAKPQITPYQPHYMGFDFQEPKSYKKGGLSGGKRYGPPPKKGPNPHGKCPFREDGIRGVGAVQPGRGVKFVGVK
jgi:hypothetical protein